MKLKQLDALETVVDTLSTCIRDARNIRHELFELNKDTASDLPSVTIFPKQNLVEVLKDVEDKAVAIVVRLQASYFTVYEVVKKEWKAGR